MSDNNPIIKECKKHGLVPHSKVSNSNYLRCRKCGVEAVKRKRQRNKLRAIEYKGGKCCSCGYSKCAEALEFHHIDPTQKDFQISSKNHAKSWETVKLELDKCMILCANCHRELHVKLRIDEDDNNI